MGGPPVRMLQRFAPLNAKILSVNILVRTPNWLGDFVMSLPFFEALKSHYPDSNVDIIVKKELRDLAAYVKGSREIITFSQGELGLLGSAAFGKGIGRSNRYDLFFSLPDSFSSALMGFFSRSKIRVGYKSECRGFLLTHAYRRDKNQHRVKGYLGLLENYTGKTFSHPKISISSKPETKFSVPKGRNVVLNINSEAPSRKMPIPIAERIIRKIEGKHKFNIILTGAKRDEPYVSQVMELLTEKENVTNLAGKTTLAGLVDVIRQAEFVITTDSGMAHLSNAVGIKTIVLFGAGDERITGPYNSANLKIVRKDGVPCAPCVSNTCKIGTPICMTEMDPVSILKEFDDLN